MLCKIVPAKNDKCVCASVCVCFTDGNLRLRLYISNGSESELALTETEKYNRLTGSFQCQVFGCSSTFRRPCQLATHYTEFHQCDFGPPRDQHDLEMYNRGINSCSLAASGKRKRSPSTSKTRKRTCTNSR